MPANRKILPAGGSLAAFQHQIYSCTRCGSCIPVCPTFRVTGEEALSARGRVSLMEAVLDGRLGLTSGLAERLSKCLECGACADACPSGVDIPALVLAMRSELARSGSGRLPRVLTRGLIRGDNSRRHQRLLGLGVAACQGLSGLSSFLPWLGVSRGRYLPVPARRPLDSMLPEVSPVTNARIRIAFFPGCATSLVYQETALAAVRVLNRAGAEVVLPRGLGCCGLPFQSLGDEATTSARMQESLRALKRPRADAIVTVCSSCALALRQGSAATPGFPPVMDIHELLAKIGTPPAVASMPPLGRVAWHDPCHLGRGLSLTHEPREIIAGLPGVEYVEAGELACCGGGVFSLLHYDLALKIGRRRAEEIAATGAGIVATGCPGCRLQLQDMLAQAGSPARVVHTVELLDTSAKATANQ